MIIQVIHPDRPLKMVYRLLIVVLVFAFISEPVVLQAQTRNNKRDNRDTQGKTERRGPTKPFSQQSLEDRADLENPTQQKIPLTSISQAAYESIIQSGRYIVGPGDGFAVVVEAGEEIEAHEIFVGASGDLIIPYIGSVSVAQQSLKEANQAIENAIKSRYAKLNITVNLSRLRTFPLNVIGEVQFPGQYGVLGTEPVSELIMRAGGLIEETDHRASRRNIQIMRLKDGQWQSTDRRADLLLWNLTGKEQYNPFLLDGEQIFVPALHDSISISGAVRRPGNYEFAPGDRISELLILGGGLSDRIKPGIAQLRRISSRSPQDPIEIDLTRIVAGDTTTNMVLRAGDKLYIQGEEQWVYVQGEVHFPGTYPIEQGLTLKALLERAQIKPEASLEQASLVRKVNFENKDTNEEDVALERLLEIQRDLRTDAEEALITLKTQQLSGRLPINFSAVMSGDKQSNVLLRDGDVIRLPRFVSSVRVNGAVRAPGNIPYDSTAVLIDYINRAGGFTDRAKKGDVVIIQGSTGNTISSPQLQRPIAPGDAIYVPVQNVTQGQGYRIFREVLAISASIASLLLTIKALNN